MVPLSRKKYKPGGICQSVALALSLPLTDEPELNCGPKEIPWSRPYIALQYGLESGSYRK